MSMRIQDAFNNCCSGIKGFAVATGAWIGKTASTGAAYAKDLAARVAACLKPYFEQVKTYARENKQQLIIGAIAFTVGAVVTAIISSVFCKGTKTVLRANANANTNQAPAPQTTAAPVPARA